MDARSTASSRSSPACSERSRAVAGVTLVELMVALTVTVGILGGALTILLGSRRLYASDQDRTEVNQNLRAALELLGRDLRELGERLPPDFPALEIADGADGAPDQLVVRRNRVDAVLPLCERLDEGVNGDVVRIAESGSAFLGCPPVPDEDGDGWPDNLGEWRRVRDDAGGAIWIYVYDPVGRVGEFRRYEGDGPDRDWLDIADGDWQHTYLPEQQCRIYVLEERTYRLTGGMLQFIPGGEGQPVNLVDGLTDFQLRALYADGTIADAFLPGHDWQALETIEVTLGAESATRGRPLARTTSARFFPRNVLSE